MWERLDRVLVRDAWTNLFSQVHVMHGFSTYSDHAPILLHMHAKAVTRRNNQQHP